MGCPLWELLTSNPLKTRISIQQDVGSQPYLDITIKK